MKILFTVVFAVSAVLFTSQSLAVRTAMEDVDVSVQLSHCGGKGERDVSGDIVRS